MTQPASPGRKHKIEMKHLRRERITEEQRLSKLQIKVTEPLERSQLVLKGKEGQPKCVLG